jgi:hypothetical protein
VANESETQKGNRPDFLAAVFLTAAVGSLVWGISRSEDYGWGDSSVIRLFVVAVVLGVLVTWRSVSHADPLLPAQLFREKTFTLGNMSTMMYAAAFSGNILNNVLFQRTIWQFSATKAGWFSVLSPITVAVTSMIVGRKMAGIGYRRLLVTGPVIMSSTVVGSVLFLHVEPTPWFPFLPLMFFLGIGLGATFPAQSAVTILRLPPHRFALGGAINNTFRQVGSAIGVAMVVTVQSQTEGIEGFRNGWKVAIVFAMLSALISLFQPGKNQQQPSPT